MTWVSLNRSAAGALTGLLVSLAVTGCGGGTDKPPMDFRPGKWESASGEWWMMLERDPDVIQVHLPPREEGPECVATTSGPWEFAGLWSALPPLSTADGIGYALESGPVRGGLLDLRSDGDWRVFVDYPCGRDGDPLYLTYASDEATPAPE